MPRKIKIVDVVENNLVAVPNATTDIPNDVIIPQPDAPDSPVIIPDEVADEIFKIDTSDDINVEAKAPKTGTCTLCGKTMLAKNLKYAHPRVCKNRPPPPDIPPPPPSIEQVEQIVANAIEKAVVAKPSIEIVKQQKAEIRKQRIKSLIEQAF